jgi:small-conductance mechanosensitive channel
MSWQELTEIVRRTLFTLGDTPVSLLSLLQLALIVTLSVVLGSVVRRLFRTRILSRTRMDVGLQYALARIAGYLVLVIGLLIGLSTVGIDLTSLTVLIGALGVGIGFGLQDIINNFVSGLVILFERPFSVGHRVEVKGTAGRVERIGARSTTIVTNDNIALVIPNSEFVSDRVVNWSLGGDKRVRFAIPVGVSYASDPHLVERLLLEVAAGSPLVLKDPEPTVILLGFGDSSIDFELRVWTETHFERPKVLASDINFRIWDSFKAHGIELPFPQRDVHLREPVRVRMEES